ncbi:MAG TPA: hypothetical protein VJS45_03830 [Acidimicrobiia bacterium]|jgi:predicted RecB family endonuclease|nr:hypothetical protein [Acidimicrobiia bacterium]
MGQRDRRHPDPLTVLTKSMRLMADLRLDDITRGLENFANPSARGMLESMGRTREEQIEALAGMLRNSSEEDMAEMAGVFGEAMARLAEERAAGGSPQAEEDRQPALPRTDTSRRPRGQTAAERRRQRRLAP